MNFLLKIVQDLKTLLDSKVKESELKVSKALLEQKIRMKRLEDNK